ncbi:MAG: chorismate mutase [Anaerolineae bacterium]|nr:chorismate mutase [Anaerolineae bacterium]MCO5187893.1 chorismate mutase [Anaerolineae bacterium]MCO5192651.1 chorismate mutase [Anaerolineae bacterium]MCO5197837.1 chorismate mutase [Anaerolineae bacterium]MCO5205333.1 chorismate mutase [Anaerolineae bacterium]
MQTTIQSNGHVYHPILACRGVRGATTTTDNTPEAILEATRELLYVIIRANGIHPDDVASAVFTTTADLNVTYPALAARQLGWYDVALLCGHEMEVPDGLPLCIRILLHWNTTRTPQELHHVYLREAKSLRPDRATLPPIPVAEIEAAVKHFDLSTLKDNPPVRMSLREKVA